MLSRIRFGRTDEDGFTLVELLVVIIIIGILAAIAIPLLVRQRERATQSAMRSDLRNAANFMETYYVDNQSYAANISQLSADLRFSKNVTVVTTTGNATGTYCLKATSSEISGFIVYDSDKGGVRPYNTACS